MNGMKKWQRVKEHLGILPSIMVMSALFWSGIVESFQQIFNYKLLEKVINKGEFLNSLAYTARLSLYPLSSQCRGESGKIKWDKDVFTFAYVYPLSFRRIYDHYFNWSKRSYLYSML